MQSAREKHVGIYHTGMVFNYSNNLHKVVVDHSAEAFFSKLDAIYSGDDVSLFYGASP